MVISALRRVHIVQCKKFQEKHGRKATLADQLKKHAEEIGELIKAFDGKNDEPFQNELWDCVFSMLICGLNNPPFAEGPYFTDQALLNAFDETLEKIEKRAGII